MLVRDVQPADAYFVQVLAEYLERIECVSTTEPESSHMRLLMPRKLFVSDAIAAVARSTASRWHCDESELTPWQLDSVILWARELAELEVLGVSRAHVDTDYARSVRACGHVARPVPHRVAEVAACENGHDTDSTRIRAV